MMETSQFLTKYCIFLNTTDIFISDICQFEKNDRGRDVCTSFYTKNPVAIFQKNGKI